jgi:uncharacterized protein YyaL (SSP411 family)
MAISFPPHFHSGIRPREADGPRPAVAPADAPATVAWRPWGTDAFTQAQVRGRPVLLFLETAWSAACRAMERDVFADPALARLIQAETVPVRVDADRRPDIADRYTQGGWPTTLFLTPEGEPLAGGTYLDAPELTRLLTRVVSTGAARRSELAVRAHRVTAGSGSDDVEPGAAAVDAADDAQAARSELAWIVERLHASVDPEHGGFGRGAKFPHAAALNFALAYGSETQDTALIDLALQSLDRLAAGGLSAPDGAFYRGCAGRDWSAPDAAKLLETQAELIPVLLDAWIMTGDDAYRDRALAALAFIERTLHDGPRGGFFASQAPDGSIDRVLLTDANARTITALLHAGRVLSDTSFTERAVQAIERIIPVSYVRRAGLAHVIVPGADSAGVDLVSDDSAGTDSARPDSSKPDSASPGSARNGDRAQVRGLLTDQAYASAALLDAGVAVGEPAYVELAEELMRSTVRKLWRPGRGFADRLPSSAGAGDVGLLAEPVYPFAANAVAARVLLRLGAGANRPDLLESAHAALRALGAVYRQQDVLSAELGLTRLAAAHLSA